MGLTGEESSAFLLGYFWEESSTSSLGICFNVLSSIGEDSCASSVGMMLDMPELLRKSFLLPP